MWWYLEILPICLVSLVLHIICVDFLHSIGILRISKAPQHRNLTRDHSYPQGEGFWPILPLVFIWAQFLNLVCCCFIVHEIVEILYSEVVTAIPRSENRLGMFRASARVISFMLALPDWKRFGERSVSQHSCGPWNQKIGLNGVCPTWGKMILATPEQL